MTGRRVVLAAAILAAAACDVEGTQHDQRTLGPGISILGTNIGPDGTVPSDGVIQIAFDRYLLPATITRQSFLLLGSNNELLPSSPLKTIYDPVARTVTIAGPDGPGRAWLTVDQSYKLVLPIPKDPESDIGGFRAIDRAPLHDAQSRELVFRAGPPRGETAFEPPADFCTDVMPIFQAKCSSPNCHGAGANAAAGLVLTSAEGVRETARGRVAHGANTTARAYAPEPPGKIFGLNMAIVEPGDPGSSWLMYKIELAPQPGADAKKRPPILCTPEAASATAIGPPAPDYHPLAPTQTRADAVEQAILDDLVLGQPMPFPAKDGSYALQPLTFQERERVRIWIARGAEVRECGACSEVDPGTPGAL